METSSEAYFKELLEFYKPNTSKFYNIVDKLKTVLAPWASGYCNDLIIMGSVAHNTAIRKDEKEDLDLLVSFRSDVPYTVEELYQSLTKFLKSKKYQVELRNISLRIEVNGISVDLVPAIKHPGSDFHTVWSRRENKTLQSNVQMHADIIKKSKREREIKLAKIWLLKNKASIDGIHLGFSVIEALKGKDNNLEDNFLTILKYFANKWQYDKYVDPSRPSDIISNNTEPKDKKKVVEKAKKSLTYDTWNECFGE